MQAIDIFSKEGASLEGGTSFLGGQKEEKTAPSFFDSLLKDTMNLNEITDGKVQNFSPNTTKIVSSTMENVTTTVSTGSLLDKMILETKDLINENKVTEILNPDTLSQNSSKFVDTSKDLILNDEIKNTDKVVTKKLTNVETKIQNDSVTSLLDKLVIDAKKDISAKDETQALISNLQSVDSEILPETKIETKIQNDSVTSLLNKLAIDAKKDISAKDETKALISNLQSVDSEIVPETKIETKTTLLDKLIDDAKNIIIEDKNNLKKQNIVNTSEEIVTSLDKEIILTNVEQSNIVLDGFNKVINNNEISKKTEEKVVVLNQSTLIEVESEKPKSLMDALIQNSMKKQEEFASKNIDLTATDLKSKEILSNIYLGEQKNQLNTQLNFNKTEALKLLKDGATLEDIKKGASILDLGLDSVDIEKTVSLDELAKKNSIKDLTDRKNILDNLLNEKNIRSVDVRNLITKSVEASAALIDNTLNIEEDKVVNVNSPLSFNIQTKIIGARQQMSNMMSDIARQMYENYKPPVTVFRINLHPEHLGSISIMMKNERNSDISITMSVTSQATLEALMENQSILRNSLTKTFEENTKFNLDFSSGERNQDQNSQQKQEERRNQDEHIDTQTILKLQEENKEIDDKFDYM